MAPPRVLLPLCALALLGSGLAGTGTASPPVIPVFESGDDAVVIAVIDSGLSPYHWDFLAEKMPQEATATSRDDVPLFLPPHQWLRGFPQPSAFRSYDSLDLTLAPHDRETEHKELYDEDKDEWRSIRTSTRNAVHYRWVPGTKVVGALTFGAKPAPAATDPALPPPDDPPVYGSGPGEHGTGTSSVAVGNVHGTCPECLLVFIQAWEPDQYEAAIDWAMRQPWIDAISNSYGMSTIGVVRDRVYAGSDTALQRTAVERGQAIFFSAGNGVLNDFVTPNGTLLSSQEGPDWIVTVGATDPGDADFTGSGKPADVAGIGTLYPAGYGGTTVTHTGTFSGTSNATPQVAGTYGRALWLARQALAGPSRVQSRGQIAVGRALRCGAKRRDCELRDGRLTRVELQRRLFEGAKPTSGGFAGRRNLPRSVLGVVGIPAPVGGYPIPFVTTPPVADTRALSEGYGTYRGRLDGKAKWLAEFDSRLWGVLTGARAAPARPAGERDWFRVDSWCRQHIWGTWPEGAFTSAAATPLPAPDPAGWPSRTAIQVGCQALTKPPRQP